LNLRKFVKDDLLTIVTLYWMSNTITPSMRLFKTSFSYNINDEMKLLILKSYVTSEVPVSIQYFKNELNQIPLELLMKMFSKMKRLNLVNYGGHFASFENPNATAESILSFINKCETRKVEINKLKNKKFR
jgi:microsomal epoxide hydrolase